MSAAELVWRTAVLGGLFEWAIIYFLGKGNDNLLTTARIVVNANGAMHEAGNESKCEVAQKMFLFSQMRLFFQKCADLCRQSTVQAFVKLLAASCALDQKRL